MTKPLIAVLDTRRGKCVFTKTTRTSCCLAVAIACIGAGSLVSAQPAAKSDAERLRELEQIVQEMRQQNQALQQRVQELEQRQARPAEPVVAPPPAATAPASTPSKLPSSSPGLPKALLQSPELEKPVGRQSHVINRNTLTEDQKSAPRPDDLSLDPKYRGFFAIPNTSVLIEVNAKPRVDFINDTQNPGDPSRFRPGQFPTQGSADFGGPSQFNVTAQGSRLMLDVRAPELNGNPRFYYENDFFGSSGTTMDLRVRHLYGEFHNVVLGQTWSTFVDPDVSADTVDYEGPNSAVSTRQPLIRYLLPFAEEWQAGFGIEQPNSSVNVGTAGGSSKNRAPDFGANLRWEKADVGHVQLAGIVRLLGVTDSTFGNQEVVGGGMNLSGALQVFGRDNVIAQLTYGTGIGHYGNDSSSFETDAAFDSSGNLVALPYLGVMAGYTHRWTDRLRSSLTYGFDTVDNPAGLAATAYKQTHYGALNLIWQPFEGKHLSVGLETLYGHNEVNDGATAHDWRVQLGIVYSLF